MSVNVAALANLRPGMPVEVLAAIVGESWIPLTAENTGYYFGLSDSFGFTARIDIDGRIASVGFAKKFPGEFVIHEISSGMPKEQVLAAHPTLQQDYFDEELGIEGYVDTVTEPYLFLVRFKENRVLGFNLEALGGKFSSETEWVPAPAGKYPEPAGEPGAPFADPNLKLVVLNDLMNAKKIDLGTPEELAAHVMQRYVDLEKEGYKLLQPAYDYLARYPLTQGHLDAVNQLYFDGGDKIYEYVFPFWDGEDEIFDVHSVDGIEHCKNLKRIVHNAMVEDTPELMERLAALQKSLKKS